MIKNIHLVSAGLVVICITALVTNNQEVAVAALAALAGWIGGNHNGKNQA